MQNRESINLYHIYSEIINNNMFSALQLQKSNSNIVLVTEQGL